MGGFLGFCHGNESKLCNLRSYKLSGRWEEDGKWQQTLDLHHTSVTPPPAECHVAKKKKIWEETLENEVSQ
jgi:hypothetical protein